MNRRLCLVSSVNTEYIYLCGVCVFSCSVKQTELNFYENRVYRFFHFVVVFSRCYFEPYICVSISNCVWRRPMRAEQWTSENYLLLLLAHYSYKTVLMSRIKFIRRDVSWTHYTRRHSIYFDEEKERKEKKKKDWSKYEIKLKQTVGFVVSKFSRRDETQTSPTERILVLVFVHPVWNYERNVITCVDKYICVLRKIKELRRHRMRQMKIKIYIS